MEMGERILRARLNAGFRTKSSTAKLLWVSPAALGRWELPAIHPSATHPTVAHLSAMAELFGVTFEWLATGRGAMHLVDVVSSTESGEYSEFIARFQRLSEDQQIVLNTLVEQFLGGVGVSERDRAS